MRIGRPARFSFAGFLESAGVPFFRFEFKGYDFEKWMKLFPSLFSMLLTPVIYG
jgi:hypothetical protein